MHNGPHKAIIRRLQALDASCELCLLRLGAHGDEVFLFTVEGVDNYLHALCRRSERLEEETEDPLHEEKERVEALVELDSHVEKGDVLPPRRVAEEFLPGFLLDHILWQHRGVGYCGLRSVTFNLLHGWSFCAAETNVGKLLL